MVCTRSPRLMEFSRSFWAFSWLRLVRIWKNIITPTARMTRTSGLMLPMMLSSVLAGGRGGGRRGRDRPAAVPATPLAAIVGASRGWTSRLRRRPGRVGAGAVTAGGGPGTAERAGVSCVPAPRVGWARGGAACASIKSERANLNKPSPVAPAGRRIDQHQRPSREQGVLQQSCSRLAESCSGHFGFGRPADLVLARACSRPASARLPAAPAGSGGRFAGTARTSPPAIARRTSAISRW